MDKITRYMAPALLIDYECVSIVFNDDEVVDYGYNDERRKVVIPKNVFVEWIKENYKDLIDDED